MKVRIGLSFASVRGPQLPSLVDKVASCAVDSLWFSEQLTTPSIEPMTGMAYALARTDRLKVGAGLAVLPGRNPVLFAKQLASLSSLAPRRVLPVVGVRPYRRSEWDAFPVPAGLRGAVFDEALLLLRRLLSEPNVTFQGEFFTVREFGLGELPASPLDIWLGGASPAALRRIARLGDGWLGGMITPEEAAAGIEIINEEADLAGRRIDPEHFGLMLQMSLDGLAPSQVEALRAYRPDVDPAELMPVGWDAARDAIEDFVKVGISKFVVYPAVPPASAGLFVDAFARELMPLQT
ncbi:MULTISPECIES: TIGR03854 family LLM class F420-dependent oxidoreductase [Pseudofrankia]|uniref:TIGR03854 family LLM class F420-dependent oxidoreductase n=1 Tax=Pseudofrankia TaxID=2994363 RepID=UPI000482B9AF|nr:MULTISPECIES: TIGR03854 family LLM class F420-dependent oxidoreductase [Pseudofrankia]OHV37126.1 LLM class F420-dependent oxidoreductase [Pseudofrankia sp. EUN1h]